MPDFGEKVFARFSNALADLKSDLNLTELIEPYSRVTREDLTTFLESAFWASLSPEEGRHHGFRLSLGPPSPAGSDYSFSQPKTYSPDEISDISAVLANSHRSLGVWYSDTGVLQTWGIADLGYWDINVTANGPGQLLTSMLGGETSFKVAISGSWWGFVDKDRYL